MPTKATFLTAVLDSLAEEILISEDDQKHVFMRAVRMRMVA